MASIKKNFIYSGVLSTLNYLFPLITYPYVSRVLGVNNIGICNFTDSIVNYFILFSMLGISTIGVREIAACGSDVTKRSRTFSSLLFLNAITTIIAVVAFLVCIFLIPELYEYKRMMMIGVAKLVFNFFLIEWFYKGIEDFKYITVRSVIIRLMYTVAVFFVVKTADDYWKYFLLITLTIVINSFVNCFHSRKYVSFSIKYLSVKAFIGSFLILGTYQIVTSLYTTFNVAYLGFVTDTIEVGYYSTAHKLYGIIIALYSAFTGVMLPRMSSVLEDGRMDEFKKYINKSISILFSFAIPLVIYSVIYSPEIIRLLSGPGYEGAIMPMRIVMPLVLIIGYEQILIIQVLMPMRKDKVVFKNSIIGAAVGLLLNFMLVSRLAAVGSSVTWLFSEIAVLASAQNYVTRNLGINFPLKSFIMQCLSYLPMLAVCILISIYVDGLIIKCVLSAVFSIIYFLAIQKFIIKDSVVISVINQVVRKASFNKSSHN